MKPRLPRTLHRSLLLSSVLRAGLCRTRLAVALGAGGCFLSSVHPASAQTLHAPGGTVGNISGSNVGIGTTSPGEILVLDKASGNIFQRFDQNGTIRGLIGVTQNAGQGSGSAVAGDMIVRGQTNLLLDTEGTTRLTIKPGGYVGIGTSSPGNLLNLHGAYPQLVINNPSAGAGSQIRFQDNGTVKGLIGHLSLVDGVQLSGDTGTAHLTVRGSGNVGIGTTNPSHKLAVNGTIRAKEIIVDTGWSDYVFKPGYRLASLSEVEGAIQRDGHLPGIPSAAEVEAGGVSLGDMQARLLAKVEELTLHVIAQNKRLDDQSARLAALEQENQQLRAR